MIMDIKDYSPTEMLAVAASRLLKDKTTVFCGTGIPMVAGLLAQKTHAPNLVVVFEAGGIGPKVPTLPISVGDSRTFHSALLAGSMDDVMSAAQLGFLDYGFIGGAEIDKFGNVNSTCIGSHDRPKVCLPGSGGGNDVGSLCWKTIITTPHEKRRLVEKVQFVTTPGYLDGPGAREAAGLPANTGPYRVVTNLAILGFDESTKVMRLLSMHPGVTLEQVRQNMGFEPLITDKIEETAYPTQEELNILRAEIDPYGIFVKQRR